MLSLKTTYRLRGTHTHTHVAKFSHISFLSTSLCVYVFSCVCACVCVCVSPSAAAAAAIISCKHRSIQESTANRPPLARLYRPKDPSYAPSHWLRLGMLCCDWSLTPLAPPTLPTANKKTGKSLQRLVCYDFPAKFLILIFLFYLLEIFVFSCLRKFFRLY